MIDLQAPYPVVLRFDNPDGGSKGIIIAFTKDEEDNAHASCERFNMVLAGRESVSGPLFLAADERRRRYQIIANDALDPERRNEPS